MIYKILIYTTERRQIDLNLAVLSMLSPVYTDMTFSLSKNNSQYIIALSPENYLHLKILLRFTQYMTYFLTSLYQLRRWAKIQRTDKHLLTLECKLLITE